MNASSERKLIRILHLILSIPILGYLYGPVASIPSASRFTRWVAMPAVIISGFWLWLKPHLFRAVRQRQRLGTAKLVLCVMALSPLLSSSADAQSRELKVGDGFPYFSGQTVTGKPLELPKAAAGRNALVIVTFGRASGKDGQVWNVRLAKDMPQSAANYTIILAEYVPSMFRGKALSGIKKGMPLEMQDRAVLLLEGEKLWRQRLGVSDDSRAYVLLLGPGGQITWKNAGPFSEADYAVVKSRLVSH